MTNKTSGLPSALKIVGISTLVLTILLTIVIIISAISNEAEALGMLIGAGTIIVGGFLGLMELATSELLNMKRNNVTNQDLTKSNNE